MTSKVPILTALNARLRISFAEVGAYGMATVVAFLIDLGLLTLLVSRFGVHYALAAAISFVSAGVILYLLSVRFVFRFRRLSNPTLELMYFIGLGVAGLGVQTVVIIAAVEGLHLHYLLAKIGAAGCTFVANFLLRRTLLFTPNSAT